MITFLTYLIALVLGYAVGSAVTVWRRHRYRSSHVKRSTQQRDEGLIIAFLAEHGPCTKTHIEVHMKEFTRGEHSWISRDIDKLLGNLERAGAITRELKGHGYYTYRLTAPAKLLKIAN